MSELTLPQGEDTFKKYESLKQIIYMYFITDVEFSDWNVLNIIK